MSNKFEIGDSAFHLKHMREVVIISKVHSVYEVIILNEGSVWSNVSEEELTLNIPKFRVHDKVKVCGANDSIFIINSIEYSRPNYYYWITKIDSSDQIPANECQLEKIENETPRLNLVSPLYKKDDKVKHIDGKEYIICKIIPTRYKILYILNNNNDICIAAFENTISPIITTATATTTSTTPKYKVGDKVIYYTIIHTIVRRNKFMNCTDYVYDICLVDMYGEYVAHKNNISETELSPVLSKFKIGDKVKISRSQLLDTGIAESNSRVCPCDKTGSKYTVTYIKLINSEYLYNLEFSSGPYYHLASDVPESDIEFDEIIDSKYKEGDCVIYKGVIYIVNNIYYNNGYIYEIFIDQLPVPNGYHMSEANVPGDLLKPVLSKFKVGDKVRYYFKSVDTYTITHITIFKSEFRYSLEGCERISNVPESHITLALTTDKVKDLDKDLEKLMEKEKKEIESEKTETENKAEKDTLSLTDKDVVLKPKYKKGDQLIYIDEVYIVDWVYIHNKVCFYKISSVNSTKTIKHIPESDLSPVSRLFKPGDKIKDKQTSKILTIVKNILKVTDSNNVIFDIEAELITPLTPQEFENIKKIETYDKRIESLQNDLNKLVKERKDLADLMQ